MTLDNNEYAFIVESNRIEGIHREPKIKGK